MGLALRCSESLLYTSLMLFFQLDKEHSIEGYFEAKSCNDVFRSIYKKISDVKSIK